MTNRVQKIAKRTTKTLVLGSDIIAERHEILTRMIEDDIDELEREALAQRFLQLGIQWHRLAAESQTKH